MIDIFYRSIEQFDSFICIYDSITIIIASEMILLNKIDSLKITVRAAMLVMAMVIFALNSGLQWTANNDHHAMIEVQDFDDNQEETEELAFNQDLFISEIQNSNLYSQKFSNRFKSRELTVSNHFRKIPSPPPEMI